MPKSVWGQQKFEVVVANFHVCKGAHKTHVLRFPKHFLRKEARRIDQFRCIKIQPITIDLSMTLWGITIEFVGFIPKSLVLRAIVLD